MVKKVKKAFETIDKKTYRRYIFPRFFLTLIIGALAVLGGSSAIEYYLFNENPLLLIVFAPIIEEIGKFVLVYFLLYLARTKWYAKEGWINTGITQGFIVGLVVGIGETLAYPGTIILKFARISSIIVHADSTAIGGYGLDFKNRWLISIFLLIAIAIHSGYNYLTTMTPLEGLWAYSFILLIFIIFLIRRQLLKGKN